MRALSEPIEISIPARRQKGKGRTRKSSFYTLFAARVPSQKHATSRNNNPYQGKKLRHGTRPEGEPTRRPRPRRHVPIPAARRPRPS